MIIQCKTNKIDSSEDIQQHEKNQKKNKQAKQFAQQHDLSVVQRLEKVV